MLPTIATGNVASALVGEYDVANSCRFDRGSSSKLSKSISSSGNRKTWTWSAWIKRGNLPAATGDLFGTPYTSLAKGSLYFDTSERLYYSQYEGGGASNNVGIRTNRVFRDTSAWYHICLIWDTTDSTADDRIRLYINGTRETDLGINTNPSLNLDGVINNSSHDLLVAGDSSYASLFFDGYMCEVVFIDGQALLPDNFGEFDSDSPNIWKPKDVSDLTFGTNGFYLDFEDSSNLGNDAYGGTDFTESNLAATDQSTDTCTNNGCTLVNASSASATYTLSEGNLKVEKSASNWYGSPRGNMGVRNGKWYYECKVVNKANGFMIGYMSASNLADVGDRATNNFPKLNGFQASGYIKRQDNTEVNISSSFTWANGDIAQIALDMDNKKLWIGKNGSYYNSGDPASGSNETIGSSYFDSNEDYLPVITMYGTNEGQFNFGSPPYSISSGNADANGHGNFEYAVPSGYFALNTKNLAEFG